MNEIALQSRPTLASNARLQTDRVSGEPVLLYPEGILELNASSEAILRLCDGGTSVEEMLGKLAEQFDADAAALEDDVLACLCDLHDRQLIHL